ncbi:MAG TPA: hypothetical protein VN961_17830 [Streptosporangiaceae bacterium]|nr:hypothetical protein [Streptosporangiaceae bacterium]
MRAPLTAMAVLAALAAAGCGDPRRGDVQVFWTFSGQTCQQAGVHTVQLDVADELLSPNQFSCTDPNNGRLNVGADLGPFLHGSYDLTVTALDSDGFTRFQSSQTFTVQGDTEVHVDVQPVATADVSWDALTSAGGFAHGAQGAMTCAEAQVDTVRILLDPNPDGTGGTSAGEVACNTGGVEGAQVAPMPTGTHSFAIRGIRNTSAGPRLVYQTTRPVSGSFAAGLITLIDVAADPVGTGLGSATLTWDFSAAGGPACPITYTLTDPSGAQAAPQTTSNCAGTLLIPSVAAGLWGIDATAGTFHAHVLFAVPNQATGAWQIPFAQ